ncbi:hypothetical protein ABZ926_25005 [Streptomyces litmocidini]|uniref:Uncharacterized protein n=1 Tax=Streptomyces litmocidini TaxID=67318 RepID=A0ABW7U7V7_9ACTN|nr:hypothetical protein [Streptomyces sp. PanSC19]ROQ35123.1 hypothetical protein EDD98_4177 [Streptomyces sp. PanSC19]
MYFDDWEKRQAYDRGRQDERDRIRRSVDGDDGDGCFGVIFLCVIIYVIVKACSG